MASEYIERTNVLDIITNNWLFMTSADDAIQTSVDMIRRLPAANIIERDEGIRIGAELAAMHGSDATSEDLERAYWNGFEEAMKKRDVRPVVRGKWIKPTRVPDSMLDECSVCGFDTGAYTFNFCPNCGADMREVDE